MPTTRLSKQVVVAAGFSCASIATRIKCELTSKEEALQRSRIASRFVGQFVTSAERKGTYPKVQHQRSDHNASDCIFAALAGYGHDHTPGRRTGTECCGTWRGVWRNHRGRHRWPPRCSCRCTHR